MNENINIEAERELFEAEIRKLNPKELFIARWPDGSYKHHGTDGRWQGWLMARRTPVADGAAVDLPELPEGRPAWMFQPSLIVFSFAEVEQIQREAISHYLRKQAGQVGVNTSAADLEGRIANLRMALREISEVRFGWDGDCGVTRIADEALYADDEAEAASKVRADGSDE